MISLLIYFKKLSNWFSQNQKEKPNITIWWDRNIFFFNCFQKIKQWKVTRVGYATNKLMVNLEENFDCINDYLQNKKSNGNFSLVFFLNKMKVKFKFQKLSTILLIVDLTQEQQIFTYIRYHKTWDMMKIIIQKIVDNNWSLTGV